MEEPVEETKEQTSEDGAVEEEEKKEKTEPSTKTTWEYQHINSAKPIWTRKSSEVTEEEYNDFYKSISKSNEDPLAHVHFSAEGEVTFKALLHIPKNLPSNSFQEYGKTYDNIKVCINFYCFNIFFIIKFFSFLYVAYLLLTIFKTCYQNIYHLFVVLLTAMIYH